jgi:hypothetical protein
LTATNAFPVEKSIANAKTVERIGDVLGQVPDPPVKSVPL